MSQFDEWVYYQNGNYYVFLNKSNGTKFRITPKGSFEAAFPESIDVKITDKCDMNCPFCHEQSKPNGKAADLKPHGVNSTFFSSLIAGQELAIGGGNVLTHPNLIPFLKDLRKKDVFPSITLNQTHFLLYLNTVKKLYEKNLIFGIGVSLQEPTNELIGALKELPTSVLHTIAGILRPNQITKLLGRHIKLLILGYKTFGRGRAYLAYNKQNITNNINWLKLKLQDILNGLDIIAFDNLALKQLNLQERLPGTTWNSFYMGEEGSHTFYVDLVNRQYGVSSSSKQRFAMEDKTIKDMFAHIQMLTPTAI